jgi:hypothetical protein
LSEASRTTCVATGASVKSLYETRRTVSFRLRVEHACGRFAEDVVEVYEFIASNASCDVETISQFFARALGTALEAGGSVNAESESRARRERSRHARTIII